MQCTIAFPTLGISFLRSREASVRAQQAWRVWQSAHAETGKRRSFTHTHTQALSVSPGSMSPISHLHSLSPHPKLASQHKTATLTSSARAWPWMFVPSSKGRAWSLFEISMSFGSCCMFFGRIVHSRVRELGPVSSTPCSCSSFSGETDSRISG